MPNYKVLNSIAHNFGQGYVSTMNYRNDDYAMGHFLRHAKQTNIPVLNIDMLKGVAEQDILLNSEASKMIKAMPKVLADDVKNEGGSIETIKAATMTLLYDLKTSRPNSTSPNLYEYPYILTVSITDDRDVEHTHALKGWWIEEPQIEKVHKLNWLKRLFS